MADDAALARFLAAAAPLRARSSFDPVRSFRLLFAAEFDGHGALSVSLDDAREVGIVAVAAATTRNVAIARYALERVAIAVEEHLRVSAASGADAFPVDDGVSAMQNRPLRLLRRQESASLGPRLK